MRNVFIAIGVGAIVFAFLAYFIVKASKNRDVLMAQQLDKCQSSGGELLEHTYKVSSTAELRNYICIRSDVLIDMK